MTDTQRNALKIVIEAVVSGASNGYTVKIDDIVTVIEGIIEKEKETQFTPGLYPNSIRLLGDDFQDFNTPRLKPGDTHGVEQPKLWDQIVYTYNSTSTTDNIQPNVNVNSNEMEMICEKNPIKPIEPNESITWDDNEF